MNSYFMMKILVKISKFLHKWIGLFILIIMILMSLSGIILNHPETFSEFNVDKSYVPKQYHLENWNRSSLISIKFLSDSANSDGFIYGNTGIYYIDNNGIISNIMTEPFPKSAWNRRTKSIEIVKFNGNKSLLAGTFDGLYLYDIPTRNWRKIELNGKSKRIQKILVNNCIINVFTESELYRGKLEKLEFRSVKLIKNVEEDRISILQLFFKLHSGDFLGIFGRLIFDAIAIIITFLSVSAIYIWIYPKKRKFDSKRGVEHKKTQLNIFKIFNKYHLKLGIYTSIFLLIIAGTGLFMRPPFIGYILSGSIPEKYYPGISYENKFKGQIRNALYEKTTGKFLLDTKDGVWVETLHDSNKFHRIDLPVPIFAMGATVFEQDNQGDLLIGSFAGLFKINTTTGKPINLTRGNLSINNSSGRPSENLITGYFKDNNGNEYFTSHFTGLNGLNNKNLSKYSMPKFISDEFKLSLWHYAFEIHNARFFFDWIGNLYILVIPVLSILFLIIILTGIFDWIWRKRKKINQVLIAKT